MLFFHINIGIIIKTEIVDVLIENVIFSMIETINTYNGVSFAYVRETRDFTFCSAILLRKCKIFAKQTCQLEKHKKW